MSIERDLQFVYEVGMIRFIQRAWKQILGPDFANLAEHHYRILWLALLLAKMEGVGNHEKILKMALIHDLPESRTGDVHYVSRLYTKRSESEAIDDIVKNTSLEEMGALWHEYEKRDCIEAKIVKDADTLDVDFELHEQAYKGDKLEQELQSVREKNVYPRLFTESAKKLWQQIKHSNPHDWHTKGKNRHTAGDWKNPIET